MPLKNDVCEFVISFAKHLFSSLDLTLFDFTLLKVNKVRWGKKEIANYICAYEGRSKSNKTRVAAPFSKSVDER